MDGELAPAVVMVAVDGSEESFVATEHAVAIAERYDADIHALYVLDEAVVDALRSANVDAETVAEEIGSFLDGARGLEFDGNLTTSSASGYVRSELGRHPGRVILDVAEEVDADVLVVPREPVGGDPGEVLGKAAQHVLAYADQPVLSV